MSIANLNLGSILSKKLVETSERLYTRAIRTSDAWLNLSEVEKSSLFFLL